MYINNMKVTCNKNNDVTLLVMDHLAEDVIANIRYVLRDVMETNTFNVGYTNYNNSTTKDKILITVINYVTTDPANLHNAMEDVANVIQGDCIVF